MKCSIVRFKESVHFENRTLTSINAPDAKCEIEFDIKSSMIKVSSDKDTLFVHMSNVCYIKPVKE
jgi:hypothetical protein